MTDVIETLLKLANGDEEEGLPKKPAPPEAEARIRELLKKNPSPSDEVIHELAEEMGIHPSMLEAKVYAMLGRELKTAQKHEHVPDSKYPQDQLRMGIKVEKEHTDSLEKAKEIAKDHLSEFPDYYTRLKKMEDSAKAKEGSFREGFDDELAKMAKFEKLKNLYWMTRVYMNPKTRHLVKNRKQIQESINKGMLKVKAD